MKQALSSAAAALIAAAAGLVIAPAHAASGYTVSPSQEAQVHVGMTLAEVQQVLGHPLRQLKFGNEPGPTWTYDITGSADHEARFDVDFDADGKVASASEHMNFSGRK